MIASTTSFLLALSLQTGFWVVDSPGTLPCPAASTSAALLAFATDPGRRDVFDIPRGTVVMTLERKWLDTAIPGAVLYLAVARVHVCSGPLAGAEVWMLQGDTRRISP